MNPATTLVAFLSVWNFHNACGDEIVTDLVSAVVRRLSQNMVGSRSEVPIADFTAKILLTQLNATEGKFVGKEGFRMAGEATSTSDYTGGRRRITIAFPIMFPQFHIEYGNYTVIGLLTHNKLVTGSFSVKVGKNRFHLTFDVDHFKDPDKCVVTLFDVETEQYDRTNITTDGFRGIGKFQDTLTMRTLEYFKSNELMQSIIWQILDEQLPNVFNACEYRKSTKEEEEMGSVRGYYRHGRSVSLARG